MKTSTPFNAKSIRGAFAVKSSSQVSAAKDLDKKNFKKNKIK